METSSVEVTSLDSRAIPLDGIRWPAVFAGLAVGLGVNLLLMLFGVAAGFAVYGAGGRPDGSSLSIAAGVWNTISMIIAALIGGYVAARSSGLRRNIDGVIHGVVAWGASMLFFAMLTSTVTGGAISGIFGAAVTPPVAARPADAASVGDLLSSLERGDRQTTINIMRDRFGLNDEQAGLAADRALALAGRPEAASPEARREVSDAAQTASAASTWLSVMILLSLLAGAGGGLLGAHGARKRGLHGRYDEQRIVRRQSTQHNIPLTS